jgi:hypothetical protein
MPGPNGSRFAFSLTDSAVPQALEHNDAMMKFLIPLSSSSAAPSPSSPTTASTTKSETETAAAGDVGPSPLSRASDVAHVTPTVSTLS